MTGKHEFNVTLIVKTYGLDTFKAYDKDNDGKVSMKDFVEMYEESWKTAFRFVG